MGTSGPEFLSAMSMRAVQGRAGRGRRAASTLLAVALLASSCGSAFVYEVAEGTYVSLVPSTEQVDLDSEGALPGGVAPLRENGVNQIEVAIGPVLVTFRVDGIETATRLITDRVEITDSEGSGPIKAKKQLLVLGDAPLVLRGLVIDNPVIWPGSFDQDPVITIKPRNLDERGPVVSCGADEACLLLSSGVNPAGSYADANNPELNENPIDSILIDDQSIVFGFDDGDKVTVATSMVSSTRACGLAENHMWGLPAEMGLPIDDPVLVHTLCPSTPGASIQLVIMDRSHTPTLAPLTDADDGQWCTASPHCLLFVPT